MDFGFSDEQEMLRETARRFLAAECPTAFVRKMLEHETSHSTDLWKKLAGMGWLGILVPRRFGGLGGSFLDATVLLEEMGAALLPGPYFASAVVGASILASAASHTLQREILPRLCEGSALLTLAMLERSERLDASGIRMTARRSGTKFVLSGRKVFVMDAAVADWIIVAARTGAGRRRPEDGITLFLVEASTPGMTLVGLESVDRTRRLYDVAFERVTVPSSRVVGRVGGAWPALRRVLDRAMVGVCLDDVGVGQSALDRTVAYATERTQFGRPIGSFQAIQHKCVDMMAAVENARSLSYFAAWAVDGGVSEAARAVPMAKAYCSEMGRTVTREALQVHGGIGFTWEHDVHLYYRRALANEAAFGTARTHRETVAAVLDL